MGDRTSRGDVGTRETSTNDNLSYRTRTCTVGTCLTLRDREVQYGSRGGARVGDDDRRTRSTRRDCTHGNRSGITSYTLGTSVACRTRWASITSFTLDTLDTLRACITSCTCRARSACRALDTLDTLRTLGTSVTLRALRTLYALHRGDPLRLSPYKAFCNSDLVGTITSGACRACITSGTLRACSACWAGSTRRASVASGTRRACSALRTRSASGTCGTLGTSGTLRTRRTLRALRACRRLISGFLSDVSVGLECKLDVLWTDY